MIEKNCLIVDDEAGYQKRKFGTEIAEPLHNQGIKVNLILIDVTDKELQTDEKLDIEKLKDFISKSINGIKIDVVGCDYELSSSIVNGLDVVKIIRDLRKKTKIFLYSGKYEVIIGNILNDYKIDNPATKKSCIKSIKNIYSSNIEDFLERNDYPARFVGVLKNENDTIDDIFIKKIREYNEYQFKSCFPTFEGKLLSEISDEIEKCSHSGQKFLEELIDQTISYLIKTNTDE